MLVKNEFGDLAVDSVLAQQQNITGVQEILNGCLCCTLVGQFKEAIAEIVREYKPDRVLVETSGSAFPAPIAWQIREMEREYQQSIKNGTKENTGDELACVNVKLDSIVTVIDCVNFRGYEDTSYTAKLQAQYTDLLVLNKWDLVRLICFWFIL